MAGRPSADLCGFAVPTLVTKYVDHTYVESSCGLRWGCFGRDSGGAKICHGTGDSTIADCLSQPAGTTGLVYGRTGVCHQAANWILSPAGVFVDKARGYRWSVMKYGTYGKNRTAPSASPCYPSSNTQPQSADSLPSSGADTTSRGRIASKFDRDLAIISESATMSDVDHPDRVAELRDMVEAAGISVEPETFERLLHIRRGMWAADNALDQSSRSGKLESEAYLEKSHKISRYYLGEMRDLLGNDRFEALFGEAGDHPEGLIDPDAFARHEAMIR